VRGNLAEPGPATDWICLRVPLVDGEDTSPLVRVVAVADFGNGVSWVVSPLEGYQFINPDLTVYLHRYPTTEWVCLEAATYAEPHGVGLAESRLWDERGRIGSRHGSDWQQVGYADSPDQCQQIRSAMVVGEATKDMDAALATQPADNPLRAQAMAREMRSVDARYRCTQD
jgi:hypothetical protein